MGDLARRRVFLQSLHVGLERKTRSFDLKAMSVRVVLRTTIQRRHASKAREGGKQEHASVRFECSCDEQARVARFLFVILSSHSFSNS
jgi:hypothetical protein